MMLPTIQWFKAGDTFSYSGTVAGLAAATTWVASAAIRAANGLMLESFTVTLTEAANYLTTGNLTLSLYAASSQTSEWLAGGEPQNLTVDIKFTATGDVDPIVHSEKFIIQVVVPVTP